MANRWGETETVTDFIFLGSKITADGDYSHEIKRCLLLRRKVMTNLDSILKSRDITLPTKGLSSQGYGFSSSHVWMWELDWAPQNWCFWTWWTERPDMLWSMGLQRVRHGWATELTDWLIRPLSICNGQTNTAYTLRCDEAFTTKSWVIYTDGFLATSYR